MLENNNTIKNLPIFLSALRIFIIPFFIIFFLIKNIFFYKLTIILFCFSSITDWMDGYIARNFKQLTKFGAFFDPVADKITIIFYFFLISSNERNYIISILFAIMICREVLVISLREWMAKNNKKYLVSVNIFGKIKTFSQIITIFLYLLNRIFLSYCINILFYILIFFSTFISLYSFYNYLFFSLKYLTLFKNKSK